MSVGLGLEAVIPAGVAFASEVNVIGWYKLIVWVSGRVAYPLHPILHFFGKEMGISFQNGVRKLGGLLRYEARPFVCATYLKCFKDLSATGLAAMMCVC